MGLGVLEDRRMKRPPGTSLLGEKEHDPTLADTSNLKKDGDIILVPQPSESPNDPLNWSNTWKNTIMIVLAFNSGVTTSLGPMITPGLVVISKQYKVTIDTVSTWIIGILVFWVGFTTFFTASGANIWGKRPFFVISTIILLFSNVWGSVAASFISLAAMRVVQGMASAPLETLVTSTVSDLFFVHQRGLRLSMWGVMIASGVLAGQIVAGFIIQAFGVSATFGIAASVYCILLPLTYLIVVETTYYKRQTGPNTTTRKEAFEKHDDSIAETKIEPSDGWEPKKPYSKQLAIFNGRLNQDSFWKGVWRPIQLITYPAVLFSSLVYSSFFAWLVTISLLSATIFAMPPYSLNAAQVGLTNLPLLILAIISSPISGFMADKVGVAMALRNKGMFEPEFRLMLMAVAAPLSAVGFIGFAWAVEQRASLTWCLVWITFHAASVPFATQASLSYVIDCHTRDANQAFVTINFTKAIFTFVATSYVNGLYFKYGPRIVVGGIAAINLGFSLLTIPFYFYGKRLRASVARRNGVPNDQ